MLEAHANVPNFSLRMTPLAALLILDQLPRVEDKIEALNRNYAILEAKLGECVQNIKHLNICKNINHLSEQALFPLSGSQRVSPMSATLGQAFSFNYWAGITRVSSHSKGF